MRCSAARGNNRYDTRARVTRAPRAMKRARRGRRVEIKGSRDPEATTKQTLLSVANQTCILWPNGDAERTFSGPRARIKSEIGYVSIGWAKRDYVTLEYNIWLTETFPFWLVYMTGVVCEQFIVRSRAEKIDPRIVSVSTRNIYEVNIDTDVAKNLY